ncbi:hypothetical protein [Actinotalea fermentans]|uniref:hypothetical protein n=1 Tax=Actinotalea fermentans TaxID=43671 RepID=UPI0011BD6384|nr:hypothetical protein [Actinotalea fermentans]
MPTPGPLEVYLGDAVGARTQREVAAELAQTEEAIAACMATEGFEYTPVVMVPGSFEASDDPLRGTRAFAEAYGYGLWRQPEIEPGQYTYMLDTSANTAYRESLSPEAQQAYDVALLGQPTDLGDGQVSYDGTGCTARAELRDGAEAEYLRGVQEEVADYLQSLWEGDDPRLAEVDAAWASCMRDAGYDDDSPQAAESRLLDEMLAVFEAAPDAPVAAGRVDAGAEAERRVALADQDCRDATDWSARRRAVEHELQREYLDAHRADLDALVAALGGTGVLD